MSFFIFKPCAFHPCLIFSNWPISLVLSLFKKNDNLFQMFRVLFNTPKKEILQLKRSQTQFTMADELDSLSLQPTNAFIHHQKYRLGPSFLWLMSYDFSTCSVLQGFVWILHQYSQNNNNAVPDNPPEVMHTLRNTISY